MSARRDHDKMDAPTKTDFLVDGLGFHLFSIIHLGYSIGQVLLLGMLSLFNSLYLVFILET